MIRCDPPGDSRSDLWFLYHLGKRLKELYAGSREPRDAAIQALHMGISRLVATTPEPDAAAVLREVNGYTVADRSSSRAFSRSRTTAVPRVAAGCIAVSFPDQHDNRARSREARWPRAAMARIRAGRSLGRTTGARCTTGLGRSGRPTLVGAQAAGLVGCERRRNGPATTRRISC